MVSWTNPTVGGDTGSWGTELNTILDTIKATLNGLAPTGCYVPPSGITYETIPRQFATSNLGSLSTGRLALFAINLPINTVISNISFVSNGAAVTPTHWWFGLYDSSLNQLAVTADQTTTAWGSATQKTLPIATVAAGAASSFTTTYSGRHYVGIMQAATTVSTLVGSTMHSTTFAVIAPTVCGLSDSGQTTPPAFPHTATAITANPNNVWAGLG